MPSCLYQCVGGQWVLVSGNCPEGCEPAVGNCNNEGAMHSRACRE